MEDLSSLAAISAAVVETEGAHASIVPNDHALRERLASLSPIKLPVSPHTPKRSRASTLAASSPARTPPHLGSSPAKKKQCHCKNSKCLKL